MKNKIQNFVNGFSTEMSKENIVSRIYRNVPGLEIMNDIFLIDKKGNQFQILKSNNAWEVNQYITGGK